MDSTTLRRYKSRRVPDEKRKRAAQACDRCKARKSKCVGVNTGRCQRCTRDARTCKVTTDSSYTQPVRRLDESSASFKTVDNTEMMKITWPKFLLQLREVLALESHIELRESDMMAMQIVHLPRIPQPAEISRIRKASRALPPKPVADFLISVCLVHATDIFFYFDQAQFLADVDQFYTDSTWPMRLDSGFVCLLLAVLALGSQWTELERPSSFPENLRPDGGDPGRVFYEEARSLIPDLMDRTSWTSIQAPFVLGVYSLPDRALGSAYAYMGLALRKAVALGFHQQADDGKFCERDKQMRYRLWWAVYSLERNTAIKLGRPRSIDPDAITTPLPTPLPSLDRAQRVNNIQHQIAYASLVKIIDRIAESGTKTTRVVPQSDKLQQELGSWKQSLPSELRVANLSPKDAGYRAVFHLQLNYLYAWILLGKRSLLDTIQARVRRDRQDHGNEASRSTTTGDSDNIEYTELASACISASHMILRLCESLSQNNLLVRFSFTDFQGCSIATIIAILAGIIERDSEYEARVAFGLNHLRTMALGNLPAEIAVRFVETLQAVANEAFTKKLETADSLLNRNDISETMPRRCSDGYSQWAQWLSSSSRVSMCAEQQQHQRDPRFEVPESSSLSAMMPPTTVEAPVASSLSECSKWSTATHEDLSNTVAVDSAQFPLDIGSGLDADPQMIWSHDDQLALMGLTGLDMLNFETFSHPPM